MKKKLLATTLGAVFALSALGHAFAAETTTQTPVDPRTQVEKSFFGKKGAKLETLAAEKGITVDELKAQMEKEREAKLAELAAQKGVTVEELKAEMEKNRPAKKVFGGKGKVDLEALAKEKGITVEELKAEMEREREAKLAQLAAEKGVTVEELKAEIEKNRPAKRSITPSTE